MLAKVAARVRGLVAGNYPENFEAEELVVDSLGDALVAQSLPELTEIVRLGDSWQVLETSGSASITTQPNNSTTTGLSLLNREPHWGKCYAIDSFGSVEQVADTTAVQTTGIWVMVTKRATSVPTLGTGSIVTGVSSLSGGARYTGNALVYKLPTINSGENPWFSHGTPGAQMAPALAGSAWKVNDVGVRGLYIIPPGSAFSIISTKAVNTGGQQFYFFRWHEVQLIYKP